MMRKGRNVIVLASAFALSAGLLAGCGSSSSSSSSDAEESSEESSSSSSSGGEISIFIWTEYVPDEVIEQFTEETGIKVNVTTASSNEDILAKVKAESDGTYDIVQPSDYMVEQMAEQGMLAELDHDLLTNLSNIGEEYLDPDYDPGNVYSVPYQGGVAAIGVNTDRVDIEITSYDDLFDEALKGSIVALDDYRAVIGMTARSMGYSMNETDPDILAEIEEKLLTLKDNIKVYDSDSPKSSMISGDCTVCFCWNAEIALSMEENDAIEVVFPEEGPYVFMDNWCILETSEHYDEAMEFINYMLRADVAVAVAEEYPYLNANAAAVEMMGSEYTDNEAKNPPAEVIASGEYVANLDTETLEIYNSMWTNLKN